MLQHFIRHTLIVLFFTAILFVYMFHHPAWYTVSAVLAFVWFVMRFSGEQDDTDSRILAAQLIICGLVSIDLIVKRQPLAPIVFAAVTTILMLIFDRTWKE